MITAKEGLIMLDETSGEHIWHRHSLPELHPALHKTILTENFCGYMYTCYTSNTSTYDEGFFMILLFDNSTGKEICHDECWNFHWKTRGATLYKHLPRVVASGNYLLLCSMHGGGVNDKRENLGDTLTCLKFDLEKKECKARKAELGLEPLLFLRCLADENAVDALGTQNVPTDIDMKIVNFCPLGFTYSNIVIAQLEFWYHGATSTYQEAKTIVSIDLDKLMYMHEPSTIFAAVHFPLEKNVLTDCNRGQYTRNYEGPSWYPYYRTEYGGQVRLAGVLEVLHSPRQQVIFSNFHSLRKSFVCKELFQDM